MRLKRAQNIALYQAALKRAAKISAMYRFIVMALVALEFGVAAAHARAASPCVDFVAKLPNVSRAVCEAAKLQSSGARSVKGRTIWVTDVQPENANLRVLVVGGIHGDELSSTSVALRWVEQARQQPLDATQVVHWRFIPALNPDGLLSQPPQRVNANGVDLNRNFPTPYWERDAAVYWQKRTGKDPRRWPGNKPLSEPESRFLNDEMKRFNPHLIVSIHAPYGVLDFDGPTVPPSKLGRLRLDQVGVFPGSLGNYGGLHKGVPVVTIELPNSGTTPRNVEITKMWADLRQWMTARIGTESEERVAHTRSETPAK